MFVKLSFPQIMQVVYRTICSMLILYDSIFLKEKHTDDSSLFPIFTPKVMFKPQYSEIDVSIYREILVLHRFR